MTENIIIGIIFIGAIAYLANVIKKQFSAKTSGCAKNCGGACNVEFKIPEVEK